ncbi:MAG: hypothetical protein OMM_15000, partial [Candidatus Magnetoglobus multicellularis str. Araruama]
PTDFNDKRSWTVMKAHADGAAFIGLDNVTISTENISVGLNQAEGTELVLDFKDQPLKVMTGLGSSLMLDFDGDLGEFLEARGFMHVSIGDFFMVEGVLAFQQYQREITLSDESMFMSDLFTLSAAGLNAFVGIGPADSPDAIGFTLNDVNLALAIMKHQNPDITKNWVSLRAHAGQAGFVGSDALNLTASDLTVLMNYVNEGDIVAHLEDDPIIINPEAPLPLDFHGETGA